jgi:hypothetical protein
MSKKKFDLPAQAAFFKFHFSNSFFRLLEISNLLNTSRVSSGLGTGEEGDTVFIPGGGIAR